MEETNPIFKKNYSDYLQQLEDIDFSVCASVLGITLDKERRIAQIPFFKNLYQVSPFGIVDEWGKRPDYGTCVILLKYLLMCPRQIPEQKDWIAYRDFTDAGQTQNSGLSAYALKMISKRYSGNLNRLMRAVRFLGGKSPETSYPYDLSAVFSALPRMPVLFLFNDADNLFPAQASILYERRAEHLLDVECRVMIDWYLLKHLKRSGIN